jgi:hypothetical protein
MSPVPGAIPSRSWFRGAVARSPHISFSANMVRGMLPEEKREREDSIGFEGEFLAPPYVRKKAEPSRDRKIPQKDNGKTRRSHEYDPH